MKHITCDKCGLPMDSKEPMRINNYNYDICVSCEKEILKGLNLKGTPADRITQQIFDKFRTPPNPNDSKFFLKDNL